MELVLHTDNHHDNTFGHNDVTGGCPCFNKPLHSQQNPPNFVGDDYFCNFGNNDTNITAFDAFFLNNPLWDGEGCEGENTCCQFNNPPWFCKTLPQPTTDDIELRLCLDEGTGNEDIPIEIIQIYIN